MVKLPFALFKRQWDSQLDVFVKAILEVLKEKYDDKCSKCEQRTQDCTLRKYEEADDVLNKISKYDERLYYYMFVHLQQARYTHPQSPYGSFHIAIGSSMSPAINDGDIVVLGGLPEHGGDVGDIIVYPGIDGNNTVHRVVGFARDSCVYTKGDNGVSTDKVPTQAIISKVSKIVKKEEDKELWDMLYSCMRRSSPTPPKK